MIKLGCILKVSDNTGVSKLKLIGSLRNKLRSLKIGDIIVASVVKTSSDIYKKSSIVLAVLIKTKKPLLRKDGTTLRFAENSVLIVDKTMNPKGTHVFGPVPYEIKDKYKKITSLTNNFV